MRLLAPIPRPPALGRDSQLHLAWSQTPAYHFTNADSVVGPYDDVPVAPASTIFDFELEVATVMDWTFGELLAYLSGGVYLTPGSVISSGTVPAAACSNTSTPEPGRLRTMGPPR